jgi:hypothetical protein
MSGETWHILYGVASKILPTWRGLRFRYEGSVATGTLIQYGGGFRYEMPITGPQYRNLLMAFSGREVSIGTSRTAPPDRSLGAWLKSNVTKTAVASYVGPILVEEDYAEVGDAPNRIRFKRK